MIDKNELLSLEKDVKNLLTIPRRMCEVQVRKICMFLLEVSRKPLLQNTTNGVQFP